MGKCKYAEILILGSFLVFLTSCTADNQSASSDVSIPIGFESRCSDPQGDIEIVGENSWDFVNNIADIASATIASGKFDSNSEQDILLIGIEMFVKTNPIAELSLTGNSEAGSQTVAVNIFPPSPIDEFFYYTVSFKQTINSDAPKVEVTKVSLDASPTVYSSTGTFKNGLFSVGVPLNVFSKIGLGSKLVVLSFASLMVDTSLASAGDSCEDLQIGP